jgi:YYY domain-containing protein
VSALLLVLQVPAVGGRLPQWVQAPAVAVLLPLLVGAVVLIWRYLALGAAEPAPAKLAPAATGGRAGAAPLAGGAVPASAAPEHVFALLLVFTGLLLLLGTEFAFILDNFGNRMNTVFKLYYQAWAMLAVTAAYGVYYLAARWPRFGAPSLTRAGAWAWLALGVVAVGAGLVYAPAALLSRADGFAGPATLDGTSYMAQSAPGDYAAIQWLQRNVSGNPVVVEASGGSYTQFARVSTNTGLPTLLGWDGHEGQWRGADDEQRRRQADIDTIYSTTSQQRAQELLRQYGVRYVYVGSLEYGKYGQTSRQGLEKFAKFMDAVYSADGVTIYRVRGQAG